MKVVILCGGKGTRMADAHFDAKALVEIGGKPILWHIMKIYATNGFNEFVLTLGHGGDAIKRYFLDYTYMSQDFTLSPSHISDIHFHQDHDVADWKITFANTGLETNKGARVRRVLPFLQEEPFHLTYGDGLADIDLRKLTAFHQSHRRLATITVYKPFSQYGIVQVDENGLVTGFEEKPRLADWINAGFMICQPELASYVAGDDSLDLEQEVLVRLAADRQLVVYRHDGFWRSMDTFKEAREMNELWEHGAPWKVWP